MEFRNKHIFISGGAGVIGTEMVQLLKDSGAIVMVGDLKSKPIDFPAEFIYRKGDLNEITQEELDEFNPEIFIHLAATFERSVETYEHWEENFRHNILLTHHLLDLMRYVPGIKRIVNASSYLNYNKNIYQFKTAQPAPIQLKEDFEINPRNLTGLAKLSSEVELDFLAHFKSDKFTSISARIYRGYGKNSRDVISRWVRDAIAGNTLYVYNPENIFDYIYAKDTAMGLLKLSLINQIGFVNLGTGKARKVAEIIEVLKTHFSNLKIEYKNDVDDLFEASEAEVTKLKSYINWVPEHTLETTIPQIIAYEKAKIFSRNKSFGNVLLSSASKKIGMLKAIQVAASKIDDAIKVIASDASENSLARYFSTDFWVMPLLKNLSIDEFVKNCKQRDIRYIFPSRDGELLFYAKHQNTLKENGIHVMVSVFESIENCVDKLFFYEKYKLELPEIIPAFLTVDEVDSSYLVVKERYGAGSNSIGLKLDKFAAIEHAKALDFPIFQPFIEGKELSVDAYCYQGVPKGIVIRHRRIIVNGESQVTTTIQNEALEQNFYNVLKTLNLNGHVILQAIIDEQDKIHIIECNPRFGGASTISIKAGLDSFYWFLMESIGEDVSKLPFKRCQKEISQIRYPIDMYI